MKEAYKKSLQMIKDLKIKNQKEYNNLCKYYFVLSAESLKFIAGYRRFRKIIKIANKIKKEESSYSNFLYN